MTCLVPYAVKIYLKMFEYFYERMINIYNKNLLKKNMKLYSSISCYFFLPSFNFSTNKNGLLLAIYFRNFHHSSFIMDQFSTSNSQ